MRRDRELRVWNLVKGKVTYHSKLAAEADLVDFTPSGDTVLPLSFIERFIDCVELSSFFSWRRQTWSLRPSWQHSASPLINWLHATSATLWIEDPGGDVKVGV